MKAKKAAVTLDPIALEFCPRKEGPRTWERCQGLVYEKYSFDEARRLVRALNTSPCFKQWRFRISPVQTTMTAEGFGGELLGNLVVLEYAMRRDIEAAKALLAGLERRRATLNYLLEGGRR